MSKNTLYYGLMEKNSQWTKNQTGALWKKQTPKGKYLSGYIEVDGVQHKIIVFPNKFKQKPNQPDFIAYKPFNV